MINSIGAHGRITGRVTGGISGGIASGIIAIGLLWICTAGAWAQYRIFSWENFEQGVFPPTLTRLHNASPENSIPYQYANPQTPKEALLPASRQECAQYGLKLINQGLPDKDDIVTVVSNTVMDRRLLGTSGRALFQADFFMAAAEEYFPNLAVLAYADSDPKLGWHRMYRFGIRQNKYLYFSYSDRDMGGKIIKQDQIAKFNLNRPGWHRFQIIFEGQESITCAVDGRPTSFSPLKEPTLTQLVPGVMSATIATKSGVTLVDNLSIQWTTDDVPIPDSPWREGGSSGSDAGAFPAQSNAKPGSAASASVARAGTMSGASTAPNAPGRTASPGQMAPGVPAAAASGLAWMTSPEEAWSRAMSEKRMILAVFYAPKAKYWQQFEQLAQSDPSMQQWLSKFLLIKIDMNTLRGGDIAQSYHIFRVPYFLAIGPDGKARGQGAVFGRESPWPQVTAAIDAELAQPKR